MLLCLLPSAALFVLDAHQANVQPHLLLFNFPLRFNPTATFLPSLRVTRDSFRSVILLTSPLRPNLISHFRFCQTWRAFVSTIRFMLPFISPLVVLFACPPFLSWNFPYLTWESTLPFHCSPSDLLLSRQGATLALLDILIQLTIFNSFLFSSMTLALFSPLCSLFRLSFYLNLSGRSGKNCRLFYPVFTRLQWIFGHMCLLGNDVADELAR